MEESLNLKARELLATPSHEGAEILVTQLSMPQETNEYQSAFALFNFCADNFPNCLTLMFLKLYRYSSNGVIRLHTIYLLSETLAEFRLSRVALHEIKPLVIECLAMQETKESDMKYLRRIVSLITYNVLICNNGGWFELSDCILWLADNEPVKAFHVFIDLPPVYKIFIDKFMHKLLEKAEKVLLDPVKSNVEDWSLALETVVKMGIQILDTEMRYVKMVENLLSILGKSVKELVEKGKEQFLVQGLEHLEKFLEVDKNLCNYNKEQCHFVMAFMSRIKSFGTQSTEVLKKINRLVQTPGNRAGKHSRLKINPLVNTPGNQDHGESLII